MLALAQNLGGYVPRPCREGRAPLQTKQGNRPTGHDQEGRRGLNEVVPGTSVFPLSETGVLRCPLVLLELGCSRADWWPVPVWPIAVHRVIHPHCPQDVILDFCSLGTFCPCLDCWEGEVGAKSHYCDPLDQLLPASVTVGQDLRASKGWTTGPGQEGCSCFPNQPIQLTAMGEKHHLMRHEDKAQT